MDAAGTAESFVVALYFIVLASHKNGTGSPMSLTPENVLEYSADEVAEYNRGKARRDSDVLVPLQALLRESHGFVVASVFGAIFDAVSVIVRNVEVASAPEPTLSSRLFPSRLNLPAPEERRQNFVRELAAMRVGASGEQVLKALGGSSVRELEGIALMALPEASILRVVEQYIENKQQPIPDQLVIRFLNGSHTELLRQAGTVLPEMAPPFSLLGYCRHFVRKVHPPGIFVPNDAWVSEIARRAFKFCRGDEIATFLVTDYGLT